MCVCVCVCVCVYRAGDGGRGAKDPSLLYVAKRKKGSKGKK